jgi:hypothetical protein
MQVPVTVAAVDIGLGAGAVVWGAGAVVATAAGMEGAAVACPAAGMLHAVTPAAAGASRSVISIFLIGFPAS